MPPAERPPPTADADGGTPREGGGDRTPREIGGYISMFREGYDEVRAAT